MMKEILIVDDDYGVRSSLSKYLQEKYYRVEEAPSGSSAIRKALNHRYDVVILDQVMPDMSGTHVLLELKKISPASKIIMMTGFGTVNNAVDSIKRGASEYIQKPFDPKELDIVIKRCLEEQQFDHHLKTLDLDFTLGALANPLRRNILKLINSHNGIHLMKITNELSIDDHTKIVFHLRSLINAGLVHKDEGKGYHLTKNGQRTYACLKIIERHLS